ncbi:MAG: helix-turn-helix domain-containing protein [Hyphomonas sp.]|jgi:transcriptional regulator of acetoin/glycerol metabolism|nr:helix-turn-helix domain-containing protein [Hyphomonas sp.]
MDKKADPSAPAPPGAHADHVRHVVSSRSAAARSAIAASWTRSLKTHGLAPDAAPRDVRVGEGSLIRRREALGRMLSVSDPVMDGLHASLGLAGCSIFLCDTGGIVLDQRTADADQDLFRSAGLWKGADWSEAVQGTNGIGTCIADARVITVYRDQHFRDSNTVMTCMGAPVFDELGELAAVLDVSSCRSDLTQPFAALIAQAVADAARQIEADHFQSFFSGQRIVRGKGDGQRGAVLFAVDTDDLVIGATRAARQVYNLAPEAFTTPRPAGDIFGDSEQRGVGLESAERRELKRAIARADGNMAAAARALGISRATLYRRMDRLGVGTD